MRTAIWLLVAFGVFQNSFGLECYVCNGDDCGRTNVKTEVCGASLTTPSGSTSAGTTSAIPTSESPSSPTPTTEASASSSDSTSPSPTTLTTDASNSPTDSSSSTTPPTTETSNSPTDSSSTTPSTTDASDSPTDSSSSTTPPTTETSNSPTDSSPSTTPPSAPARKRRSIQYYRESNDWKCFTQQNNEGKVAEKGCKPKDSTCNTTDKCKECLTDKCNGASSLMISAFTLSLVFVISKMV